MSKRSEESESMGWCWWNEDKVEDDSILETEVL